MIARMRVAVVVLLSVLIGAAVYAEVRYLERTLLRADPDSLPANGSLLQFAVSRGGTLFAAHCSACHGLSGAGDPATGTPNLTDGDWLYGAGRVTDIEKIIDFGIRSHNARAWNLAIMPAYARPNPNPVDKNIQPLSPGDIADLIEFLMRRQGRHAEFDAASRGAALFTGQAGCYDCHSPDAKGDPAIGAPNLTDAITLYGDGSREALFMSIAYGRQGVCPAWSRRVSPAGVRELALYVYSISHPGGIQNAQ
jgi:cytochrome c oxidase cbb3-type subunit 3